jgi:DNA-binding FadR family transcriptional regulator
MSARPRQPHRIYERITASIQRQIADGRLTPGTKLPAEREMARRHKVSRVTIREAFRSLEERGILIIRRGAGGGAVIADPGPGGPAQSTSEAVTRLRLVLHQQAAVVAQHGRADRHRVDIQQALAACARNLPLATLMDALADVTLEAIASSHSSKSARRDSIKRAS